MAKKENKEHESENDEKDQGSRTPKVSRKVVYRWSVFSGFLGLSIILAELYLRSISGSPLPAIEEAGVSLLEIVGLSLFSGGVLILVLQIGDWTRYFEERLKNTVLKQAYLDSLDGDALSELQVKIMKAIYNTPDIDKEGSFLRYFQKNLSKYIKEPYRDNVKTEIEVCDPDDVGYWINDRITYSCRMVGGKIQGEVKWRPDDKEEFLEVENVEISITKNTSAKRLIAQASKVGDKYTIEREGTKKDIDVEQFVAEGLSAELADHQEDGLFVEAKSRYKMEWGKFCNWSMAHPTKNFYISIFYPKGWRLRFQPLLLHPEKVNKTSRDGFLSMEYNEWLLPFSGVFYSFTRTAAKL